MAINGDIEIETFRYSGRKAWHGCGEEIPEHSTVEAAMASSVLGSEILKVPLTMPDASMTGAQDVILPSGSSMVAIVRSGDWKTLGVRTDGFSIVQPMEGARLLDAVGAAVGAKFSVVGSVHGGTVFWGQAKVDDFDVTGDGDKVETFLSYIDGYDGKTSASFGLTTVRAVCENTVTHAIREGQRKSVAWHSIRHRGDVTGKLGAAAAAVEQALKGKAEIQRFFQKAARTPIKLDAFVDVALAALDVQRDKDGKLPGRSEGKVDVMVDLFQNGTGNAGKTAWDAFNAISEWSTWAQPTRSRERFASAMLGDPVVERAEQVLRVMVL
jgi:phage/plasmid-like protein (TIGR03299 family)